MDAVVETKGGKILGRKIGNIFVFKGIPYAEPPLRSMRWMPPKAKEPWEGIYEATDYRSICPQPQLELIEGALVKEKQSEDCLYLNIYTPGIDGKKRPVMVWIHGGAFMFGSSSHPLYRRGKIAERGVVLVTINYRLGPFGFLRLKDLSEGKIPSTGNEGILDQVCALRWIKENIGAFGGDPDNITLFGESAGGISIGCILIMEETRGLFNRVIIQSGNWEAVFDKEKSNEYARSFLEILKIDKRDIEKLKEIPQEEIVRAEEILLKEEGELTVFSPTIEGEQLKGKPIDLIWEGEVRMMPLLIGTNLEEWNLFSLTDSRIMGMDIPKLKSILSASFSEKEVESVVDYYTWKIRRRGIDPEPWRIYSQFMTDTFFLIPTLRTVKRWVYLGLPVYVYLFDWSSPYLGGKMGSCHTLELGFLFGNYDDRFFGSGKEADELSKKMQDAWTSFSRNGDPSCESLGLWPDYGRERKVMVLGKECYLTEDPYREMIEFYLSLGLKL
jgi:para-nitrobenzyl esterase